VSAGSTRLASLLVVAVGSCGNLIGLEGLDFDPDETSTCTGASGACGGRSSSAAAGVGGISDGAAAGEGGMAGTSASAAAGGSDDAAGGTFAGHGAAAGETGACSGTTAPLVCSAVECTEVPCGGRLWNSRLVPYEIGAGISPSMRALIARAAAAWSIQDAPTPSFIRCMDDDCGAAGELEWLRIAPQRDSILGSHVHQIELPPDASPHRIGHELGHVLGLPDAWQRPDRDAHVTLDPSHFCDHDAHGFGICRTWPGANPGLPPRTTGFFGPFESRSKMLLSSSFVCARGELPDESVSGPTEADRSALLELYRMIDKWAPFSPVSNDYGSSSRELREGVTPVGTPALVTSGSPALEIFARGADEHIYQRSREFNNGIYAGWSVWQDLGCCFDSDPGASSAGPGNTHLFARNQDGDIYWRAYQAGGTPEWAPWQSIGRPTAGASSAPATAAWGVDSLHVFVRGGDDGLYQKSYAGGWEADWTRITDLAFNGTPAVAALGPGSLDVVVVGKDNQLRRLSYGGAWSADWFTLPGQIEPGSSPALIPRGNDLDLIMYIQHLGDRRLYEAHSFDGFNAWYDLGGILAGSPAAASSRSPRTREVAALIADASGKDGSAGLWSRYHEYTHPCLVAGPDACGECGCSLSGVGADCYR